MRLIGIFGGTFNPIHNGHLHLAEQLLKHLNFDEIRFIPSATPALKSAPEVSAHDRADMVKLAISDNPKFTLDTRELQREGVTYTIDTLKSLRAELGEHVALYLLMGYDAFLNLPKWHQWQNLLDYAHIVVVNRPQTEKVPSPELAALIKAHQTDALKPNIHAGFGAVYFAHIPPLDISSSEIRARLTSGKPVNTLLPLRVLAYIQQHHLYRS